jgi:hypothetical protein
MWREEGNAVWFFNFILFYAVYVPDTWHTTLSLSLSLSLCI